ncbi:MAG: hypothetical protein DRI24_03720 [Deltaproteobacteria bacterium]|nr:MAG: hypothetical protein DRI24_03720 [Deltaproteobacteria bacterium]
MSSRPEYTKVDKEYREAQLSSRNSLMHKASEVDLWMRVIHRALDDVALFTEATDNRVLSKEEEELLSTARAFLYDDEYRIPVSDYHVNISCSKCKKFWTTKMSTASSSLLMCPHCKQTVSLKNIEYDIVETKELKTINLKELLDIWDIEDMGNFREGANVYIEAAIKKIKETRAVKKKAKVTKKINIIETKDKIKIPFFSLTTYTIDELKVEKKDINKGNLRVRRAAAKKKEKES